MGQNDKKKKKKNIQHLSSSKALPNPGLREEGVTGPQREVDLQWESWCLEASLEEEGRDLKTQIFLSFSLLHPLGIDQTQPEAKGTQAT